MNTTEQVVAVVVTILFVAGAGVLVAALRERRLARNQWDCRS